MPEQRRRCPEGELHRGFPRASHNFAGSVGEASCIGVNACHQAIPVGHRQACSCARRPRRGKRVHRRVRVRILRPGRDRKERVPWGPGLFFGNPNAIPAGACVGPPGPDDGPGSLRVRLPPVSPTALRADRRGGCAARPGRTTGGTAPTLGDPTRGHRRGMEASACGGFSFETPTPVVGSARSVCMTLMSTWRRAASWACRAVDRGAAGAGRSGALQAVRNARRSTVLGLGHRPEGLGVMPPDPPQRIKDSKGQRVDHKPPRTARTAKGWPWKSKSFRLGQTSPKPTKFTVQANAGSLPATVLDDQ